jgi:hypothetical protein
MTSGKTTFLSLLYSGRHWLIQQTDLVIIYMEMRTAVYCDMDFRFIYKLQDTAYVTSIRHPYTSQGHLNA